MRRAFLLLAHLALLGGPLAGCLGAVEESPDSAPPADPVPVPEPVRMLDDAAGDALELRPRDGTWLASERCAQLPPAASAACAAAVAGASDATDTAGVPAAPALDGVGLVLQETPSTIVATLEVASLDEAFTGAVGPNRWANYVVEWRHGAERCVEGVWMEVWGTPQGPRTNAIQFSDGDRCGEGPEGLLWGGHCASHWLCAWPAAVEAVPGEPGLVRITLLRDLLRGGEAGDTLEDVRFRTQVCQGGTALDLGGPAPVSAATAPCRVVDLGAAGSPFVFTLARTPMPESAEPILEWSLPEGDVERVANARQIDLVSMQFEETPASIVVTLGVAELPSSPADAFYFWRFNLPSGQAYRMLHRVDEGLHDVRVVRAVRPGLMTEIPFGFEARPGSPGTLTYTLERKDLTPVRAGELMRGSPYAVAWNTEHVERDVLPGIGAAARSAVAYDATGLAPPYRMRYDSNLHEVAPLTPPAVRLEDEVGDAVAPPAYVGPAPIGAFDIASVEARAVGPAESHVTLGIAGLSGGIEVPVGYNGVLYATALEADGRRVMLGYVKMEDQPRGDWFCAPDTLVFLHGSKVPARDFWHEISGLVIPPGAAASEDQSAGGASASTAALTYRLPHACFDLVGPSALAGTAIGAATFLLHGDLDQGAEATRVDDARSSDLFTLDGREVRVPPTFWQEPFGLENGWDILGAALAVVTIGVTIGVFVRRRRLMRWYLDELARIDRTYLADPVARAKSLVDLRRQLHRDIVRHRVSDSEYIRDRLRSSLTSARLVTVSDGFYGLPAPLAMRLERMLDDGRMTPEEAGLIEPLVEKARIPPKARALLVERLRAWVEEDAAYG